MERQGFYGINTQSCDGVYALGKGVTCAKKPSRKYTGQTSLCRTPEGVVVNEKEFLDYAGHIQEMMREHVNY